jgi:hypothetical protein
VSGERGSLRQRHACGEGDGDKRVPEISGDEYGPEHGECRGTPPFPPPFSPRVWSHNWWRDPEWAKAGDTATTFNRLATGLQPLLDLSSTATSQALGASHVAKETEEVEMERMSGRRRPKLTLLFVVLLGVALGVSFALFSIRASAAPTRFSLTFEGAHVTNPAMPAGLGHEGRFTASPPFCSAGWAHDVRDVSESPAILDVMRVHTCDDGSGGFTALMPTVRGEHGGSGTWRIVEGTGSYATLRGFGTYAATILSGDPEAFDTIVYRTQWQGVVDLDAAPPTIASFSASARKVRAPLRTYQLRIAINADDPATPVMFAVAITAGRTPVAFKRTSTVSGSANIAVAVRPPRSARSLRIALSATDAVGNTSSSSRTVKLG